MLTSTGAFNLKNNGQTGDKTAEKYRMRLKKIGEMMTENEMNSPVDLETAKDRVMGDIEFLKEMLVMFEETIPTFMESIRNAITQHDASTLSQTSHQFKGAALNLSVIQVAEQAAELEELGKNDDFEKAEGAFEALAFAVSDFREFMIKVSW